MKFIILLICLLTLSCSTMPPDVPACVNISQYKGFCTFTLSNDKDFFIDDGHLYNGQNWSQVLQHSVILPPDSWVKLKEYILAMCRKNNNCPQQALLDKINTFDKNL